MPTLQALRSRSGQLFTDLLVDQTKPPARRRPQGVAARPPRPSFSWFDRENAAAASLFAFRLSAIAASKRDVNTALADALDAADAATRTLDPELVRQGLALFVTHNLDGRKLLKPRTVVASPSSFHPPARGGRRIALSVGGLSPGLDYWREDALANEHHQHWHEVYPYSGLPPMDFREWVTDTSRADMAAMLAVLVEPAQDWSSAVEQASVDQIAAFFGQLDLGRSFALPPELYQKLYRLNDRQGELFFYMHAQMLARYDAELLSNGLARVDPFGPDQWSTAIDEGYIPTDLPNFTPRPQNQTLSDQDRDELGALETELQDAITAGELQGPDGTTVPIDRTNLGEAAEAAVAQLRALAPDAYGGLHNIGHGRIAGLSADPGGVMRSTTTAIRDQIFWRWHKHIDDLNLTWQDAQPAEAFDDGPPVVLRADLATGSPSAWSSPDIILVRTGDLPPDVTEAQLGDLGIELFGGDNWDTDFASAPATAVAVQLTTIDELVTVMDSANFGGRTITFLTHEPFTYFLRVENPAQDDAMVTVRIFLAPESEAADRRAWIEMDKFMTTIPAGTKVVIARPDTEASVIKRPAETSPAAVSSGTPTSREEQYCDCGWPYTLLLPRGTSAGMTYRLMVMCTDGAIDEVPAPDHCGSMSYCGSVDRYPDTRDMGYPFARPFAESGDGSIQDTILGLPFAAARTVTIRHA